MVSCQWHNASDRKLKASSMGNISGIHTSGTPLNLKPDLSNSISLEKEYIPDQATYIFNRHFVAEVIGSTESITETLPPQHSLSRPGLRTRN